MSARPVRLELRRGAGLPLFGGIVAVGALMTGMVTLAADPVGPWSASGPGVLVWVDVTGLILGPLAAAAGAWAGGRDRRQGVSELLGAVPRARWRRDLATVGALVAAVVAGLAAVSAITTATVLPAVSYGGGRWPLSAAVIVLGCVACLAVGFAMGRLTAHRWTPPVVALVVYVLNGIPTYLGNGVEQLAPVSNLPVGDGQRLRLEIAVLGMVWLLGLAVAAFLAGSAERRWWALLPAAAAVVAAATLAPLPVEWNGNAYTAQWTERDPAALAPVCSYDESTVCVNAVHAALLPEVTRLARPILAELPPGLVARERGLEHPATPPAVDPGVLAIPFLEGRTGLFSADLRDPEGLRKEMAGEFVRLWCPDATPAMDRAAAVATAVVNGERGGDRLTARLRGDTTARRAWLADYLRAGATCDRARFDRLAAS